MSVQSDTGTITLDHIPITCIPPGSQMTIQKGVSSTTKVSVTDGSGIVITSTSTLTFPFGPKGSGNNVFGSNSTSYSQSSSTQVTNGIVLTTTTTQVFQTPQPGTVGNVGFIGLLNPTVQISGPTNGAVFKIIKHDGYFVPASVLMADPTAGGVFSKASGQSLLATYDPINDPTGKLLVKPRYKQKLPPTLLFPGFPETFVFTKSTSVSSATMDTTTTSSTITSSTGFSIDIFKQTFSVSKTLSMSQVEDSESSVTKAVTLSTTLNPTAETLLTVFYDKVLKCFNVANLGPPGGPAVQGTVVDATGKPIAGAYVMIAQGEASYGAVTNASGTYTLAAPSSTPLASGTAAVSCGGVTQNVTIGGSPAKSNFSNINPTTATSKEFDEL